MKFIEHSNSVYKSNKKYVSPKAKRIRKITVEATVFLLILFILIGMLIELIQNNNTVSILKSSHRLGGYNDYRIAYGISGSGSTVVLFESDIGETLLEWNPIIRNSISGTRMIYYDRFGYGGTDSIKEDSNVKFQSDVLNNLVVNTGYGGPQILVSEGFGSLIHLEYLKNYTNKVDGIIMINPVIFSKQSTKNYFKEFIENMKISFMKLFSTFGIPRLLYKISISNNPYVKLYKEQAISRNKENYISRMIGKDYYETVSKERKLMKKYLKTFDVNNIGTYDMPVVIIESENNRSVEYEKLVKSHFINAEIVYFEDTSKFTYTNSEYLSDLISNINLKIEQK